MSKYWDKKLRDLKIIEAFTKGGTNTEQLAKDFNVCIKTVQRALKRLKQHPTK